MSEKPEGQLRKVRQALQYKLISYKARSRSQGIKDQFASIPFVTRDSNMLLTAGTRMSSGEERKCAQYRRQVTWAVSKI